MNIPAFADSYSLGRGSRPLLKIAGRFAVISLRCSGSRFRAGHRIPQPLPLDTRLITLDEARGLAPLPDGLLTPSQKMVDKEGIEPSSSGCKPDILPLNDSPT